MRRHFIPALFACCLAGLGVRAAEPSAGCGRAPPATPPTQFEVAGRMSQVIVALPPGYRANRPYPMVFAFHGRTGSAAQVRDYFGLEVAAMPAFLVYPAGLGERGGRFSWSEPGVALFDTLLDRLAANYCIDRAAVFVVGHSLGASFANSLACARAGRIRGVASVAGGIDGGRCGGPVAALLLHNPQDQAVPVAEGLRARTALLGRRPAAGPPLALEGDFACAQDRAGADPLLWCLHHASLNRRGRFYPHQWPPDAGATIMAFFASLPGR